MNILYTPAFGLALLACTLTHSGVASPPPAGENTPLEKLVAEGNKMLGKGEFGAALPVWIKAVAQAPSNSNINFKTGMCYFNSHSEKAKALPYFKKATAEMSDQYDFYNKKETKAPFDAIYFLGQAWLYNGQPDSAMSAFVQYQQKYNGTPPLSVEKDLLMCVNAKNSIKTPRNIKLVNLKNINSAYAETNPVLTIDNSVIFFSSRRPLKDSKDTLTDPATGTYSEDIYFAPRDASDGWQSPQAFKYNTPYNEAPLYISPNGLTLYLRREIKGNTDIYQSTFVDKVWTAPKPLKVVNSPYNENGISVSGDGKHLYFSSDREGGQGKYDIYQCTKNDNGKWSSPQNISTSINTSYNEVSPFIHPNGKTLFFCSNGNKSKGIGGYDIFYSELQADGSWSDPQSMGSPVNTTRDDISYYITSGGKRYYSTINKENSYDIFEVAGGGYDVENIDATTEVVTLTTEMSVTEVMEVQKEVEKEVQVVETVETQVEVIKEVEKIDAEKIDSAAAEPEKPKEPEINVEAINVQELDSAKRTALVEKVKNYLTEQLKSNESVVFKKVYFDFNKSNLDLLSKNELNLFLEYIAEHPTLKVEIVGHADNQGSWESNVKLSGQRAKGVYDFLLRNKLSASRMIYYGKGSAFPIASNDSEDGRKQNRRVEILILK